MKQYNNGQRPTKMYGGGMAMPRKPMMMGGLAQQNRTQQTHPRIEPAELNGRLRLGLRVDTHTLAFNRGRGHGAGHSNCN